MKCIKPKLIVLFFLMGFVLGCKKDEEFHPPATIDLAKVKLNDFQFEEINYFDFDVIHPKIVNGLETEHGEIEVVIPAGTTQLQLTPKASNFTDASFVVTPALGTLRDFSNGKVLYTITSKTDQSKKVHYNVSISEKSVENGEAAVTGLSFEKSKNPALPQDIAEARIVPDVGSMGKIYVFVPAGTNFSQLTPTIHFKGDALFYHQDPASQFPVLTPYPANGTSIDFAYPKSFYLQVKKGADVKTYDVIVDVKNPIKFDNSNVSTPDVKAGASKTLQLGTFLNQGNHPITVVGINHVDRVPDGVSAVRGIPGIPYGGVKPNQRANISALVNAQTYPANTYKVTAVFTPAIYNDYDGENLMEAARLTILSKIVE